MSSQNNWNNPDMYYQQPQSNAGSGYGAQSYGSNGAYAANTQYAGGPGYVYQPLPPTNTLSVVALVCSVAGFMMFPIIGGIAGVIMGHISKKQISVSGERGEGMAVGALWVGYVGTALWVLGFLAIIFLYLGMFALILGTAGAS
ncbi:DUF4190 domain-containing protein [Brevibacterium oceani]|uniref:DUF4190 domain-containing protein n=1 Tax=Brevibacterium oceani TaxID=358099 RepID=UPI001B31D7E0|nr:DUF4190 domain-containing protein [Brevibacterium oceani]